MMDTIIIEIRRPSIERIKVLCCECLDHDSSWWEFKDRCLELLKKEEKMIKMLEGSVSQEIKNAREQVSQILFENEPSPSEEEIAKIKKEWN